jgi:hypothetical protein
VSSCVCSFSSTAVLSYRFLALEPLHVLLIVYTVAKRVTKHSKGSLSRVCNRFLRDKRGETRERKRKRDYLLGILYGGTLLWILTNSVSNILKEKVYTQGGRGRMKE